MASPGEQTPTRSRWLTSIVSGPRLLAIGVPTVTLVIHQLFFQGVYRAGSKLVALALCTALLALPLYLGATFLGLLRVTAARRMPLLARLPNLSSAAACFLLGALGTPGNLERLAFGGVLAGLALFCERAAAPRDPPASSARARAMVCGVAAVLVLLAATPPALLQRGQNQYEINLGGSGTAARPPNIVVVGVDGADWQVLGELLARDAMPNLARVIDSGTSRPLRTLRPTYSPFLWNAVYTGFTPGLHAMRPAAFAPHEDLLLRKRARGRLPDPLGALLAWAGTPEVRYPFALWDLLEAAGYSVAVVGAFEERPVPRSGALFVGFEARYRAGVEPQGRLSLDARDFWAEPPLRDRVRRAELPPASVPPPEWAALLGPDFPVERLMSASARDDAAPEEQRLSRIRVFYPSDRFRQKLVLLAQDTLSEPYFVFAYFQGIDQAQHCYWHLHRGTPPPWPGEAGMPDVVTNYYRLVDRWIGEIQEGLGEDDILLVVSDHGIDPDDVRPHRFWTGWHELAPDGIFVSSVRRAGGGGGGGVHILDAAPTVLAMAGLPTLAGMEGRVISGVAERTVTVTDWWSLRPAETDLGNPRLLAPETEELLRSLGYLGGRGHAPP